MTVYNNLGGEAAPVDAGITEAEALLEAKKVSGYLGLLSPYYFGGVGTDTVIDPVSVDQWVDVNLSVDPVGTFDYRPQDMVDANATGFSGAGTAGSPTTQVSLSGNLDKSSSTGTVVSFDLADAGTFNLTKSSTTNAWSYNYNFNSGSLFFDFTTGAITTSPSTREIGGVTFDFSGLTWTTGATTATVSSTNAAAADPYLFHLDGLTQQSFGKMRVTGLFNPDIDEGQLDVRLLFTPNSAGTFGQFSIAEQAATMTQGAGVTYFTEPTITWFTGNTISDLGGGDAGRFQFQIRSSVEGTFTLRGLTMYIHS